MNQEQIVLTAAHRAQLPAEWLEARGVPVLNFRALVEHEAVPAEPILFLVTGSGREMSKMAAEWIRTRLNPERVIQIGTATSLRDSIRPGEWLEVEHVFDQTGLHLRLEPGLPFPWSPGIALRTGANLLSLDTSKTGEELPLDLRPIHLTDQECFAQADVLMRGGVLFHSLQWVLDDDPRSSLLDAEGMRDRLLKMRRNLETLLDGALNFWQERISWN